MDWSDKAEVYRGRKPRESPLWQLFDHHFDEFEYRYDDLFSREYAFFRPVISHIVRKYLECGDLDQGFNIVLCAIYNPDLEGAGATSVLKSLLRKPQQQ